jgi:hypothetical protein
MKLPLTLLTLALLFALPSAYAQPSQNLEPYEVTYEGNDFEIRAAMSNNAGIEGVEVYPEYGSILLTLGEGSEVQDNELTILLPRELIDSKEDNADADFLIIVDGFDVEYEEIQTTATARTLRFNLPSDAIEIEIFGSQVIPEFPFGVMIATSATIGMIILIQRTRRFF